MGKKKKQPLPVRHFIKGYQGRDGRIRVVYRTDTNDKLHTISYPRLLMEIELGRPLEPDEDVHRKDELVFNNDLENLEVIKHGPHQAQHSRKYYDKIVLCAWCKNAFVWTANQQKWFHGNSRNRKPLSGPYCSRSCASKAGRREQLRRNT